MARLLKMPRSPYYYVEYRTASGIRRESTRQRTDSREGRRNASRILTKKQAEEKLLVHAPAKSAFAAWVEPWLRQHCAGRESTMKCYLWRWNSLQLFLRERGITFPSQLTYAHCHEYLAYRPVQQNTARDELGTLRLIMNEALRRDYCLTNPCSLVRLRAAPRKERQEISDTDLKEIRKRLADPKWPGWMRVQFEIAWHTGRRISETKMAMADLDLTACTYTVRVKGGKVKTKPFLPALLPTLRQIKGDWTHTMSQSHSSAKWSRFFAEAGMPYNFHCIRVSFISRLRRAGVDRWAAMKLVDHASASIHAHYNRYDEADLRGALAKLDPDKPAQPQ